MFNTSVFDKKVKRSLNTSGAFVHGTNLQTIKNILHQILPLCNQCGYKQYICVEPFCKLPKEPICYSCHNLAQSQHFLHRKNEISLLFLDQELYTSYSQLMQNKKKTILQYLQSSLKQYQNILKKIEDHILHITQLIQSIKNINFKTKHSIALQEINQFMRRKLESKSKMCKPEQKIKLLETIKNISFQQINIFNAPFLNKFKNLYNNSDLNNIKFKTQPQIIFQKQNQRELQNLFKKNQLPQNIFQMQNQRELQNLFKKNQLPQNIFQKQNQNSLFSSSRLFLQKNDCSGKLETTFQKSSSQNFKTIQQKVTNEFSNGSAIDSTIQMIIMQHHLDKYLPPSKLFSYENRSIMNAQDVSAPRMIISQSQSKYIFSNFLQELTITYVKSLQSYQIKNLKSLTITFSSPSNQFHGCIFDYKFSSLKKLIVKNTCENIIYQLNDLKNLFILIIHDTRLLPSTKKNMLKNVLNTNQFRICKITPAINNIQQNLNKRSFAQNNTTQNNGKRTPQNNDTMKSILQIHKIHRSRLNRTSMNIKQEIISMFLKNKE